MQKANIYFNKQCLANDVTPKYANLKFTNTSPAAQTTTKKAQTIRVKNEIKFLFKKKEKLNRELYTTHLKQPKNGEAYGLQSKTPYMKA
jgi:hypothetical protein